MFMAIFNSYVTNDQRVYPINIPLNHYKIPLNHQRVLATGTFSISVNCYWSTCDLDLHKPLNLSASKRQRQTASRDDGMMKKNGWMPLKNG